ncbi:hypothetical protein AB0M02_42275 [Actinoplanes sp. NPDC051861]|uniref:hypothetical protein n=1 Tax=Actinoplanes sp. NPDC051861 TaxID=3155170 RepID=UPI003416378D
MIKTLDRLRRHGVWIKERYERWEERQVARRFSGWSVRRRLLVFVLAPTMLICCGGVTGLPVLWLLRETVEAGRGAPAPVAAADEYLVRLSYGDEDGLLPVLDDEQDHLLEQWRGYLAAMRSTDPAPFGLDLNIVDPGSPSGDHATVRIDVQAVWWDTDGGGASYKSKPRTWVIETREDDGWRVTRVDAPPWCGTGGYLPECGNNPAPAPTATPSDPPSPDPLQHPREMLRCGPRDPFRAWHSCPPTGPTTTPSA